MYSLPLSSYFHPAVPVIAIEFSCTSISISSFLKPGISAFKIYSFSPSFRSTTGTLISGTKENDLAQFAGKRMSSKSFLNLAKVSSNACQISEGEAGAKADVFLEGLLTAVVFFFVTAIFAFLGVSFSVAGFFFSVMKTRL